MEHQKTCAMFIVNIIYSSDIQLKHVACHVLDIPDLQDYFRNSNSPKTPITKVRTFEHFLKFFPDAKFNSKFRTCPEFSGWYGNPRLVQLKCHIKSCYITSNQIYTLLILKNKV